MNFLSFICSDKTKTKNNSLFIVNRFDIMYRFCILYAKIFFFLPMNDILTFSNYKEVIITDWVSYLFTKLGLGYGQLSVMLMIHFLGKLQIKLPHCQPGFQTKYQNYNWLVRAYNPSFSCSMYIANITWKSGEQVFLVLDTN